MPSRETSFNPRPRVGGDREALRQVAEMALFQSTPPRGGRHNRSDDLQLATGFNPRPRVGGDRDADQKCSRLVGVSIHAPAWGATAEWENHLKK